MDFDLSERSARVSRRHVLRSIGVFGVAGALGVGCAPRSLGPTLGPALPLAPPPVVSAASPFLESKALRDPPNLSNAVAPGTAETPVPSNTVVPLPTATPTPLPTSTPILPTATSTVAPPTPTATPLTYDEARLKDVVGHARISYAGSSFALATNIELATRRIDGAVVPPGGLFSFLDRLGPQTSEAGFQMGYGIIVVAGQAKTVPMVGGGICDVSTLLFQAVYRAGLPIVTRYAHSYWIAHYGTSSAGMLGLEATVDVPPVDFRFRNGTGDFLKVVASAQGGWVDIKLMGVDPQWTVAIAPPVVADVVKTDPTVVRQPDPGLPAGAQVWIETAQDGFDVTLSRRVTRGKQVIDEYQFTTHYLPSHNVVDVGGLSTATTTATPSTSPTPKKPSTSSALPTSGKVATPGATSTPAKVTPPAAASTPSGNTPPTIARRPATAPPHAASPGPAGTATPEPHPTVTPAPRPAGLPISAPATAAAKPAAVTPTPHRSTPMPLRASPTATPTRSRK
jgi:hypothetical protein